MVLSCKNNSVVNLVIFLLKNEGYFNSCLQYQNAVMDTTMSIIIISGRTSSVYVALDNYNIFYGT